MDTDEQMKVLEDFLTELATSFGLTATASSTIEDNELTVNLSGDAARSPGRSPAGDTRLDPGDRPQRPAAPGRRS